MSEIKIYETHSMEETRELGRQMKKELTPEDEALIRKVGFVCGCDCCTDICPMNRRFDGTGGSLTGYAGGIDRKVKLLALEQADMTRFFVPKTGTALYNLYS